MTDPRSAALKRHPIEQLSAEELEGYRHAVSEAGKHLRRARAAGLAVFATPRALAVRGGHPEARARLQAILDAGDLPAWGTAGFLGRDVEAEALAAAAALLPWPWSQVADAVERFGMAVLEDSPAADLAP